MKLTTTFTLTELDAQSDELKEFKALETQELFSIVEGFCNMPNFIRPKLGNKKPDEGNWIFVLGSLGSFTNGIAVEGRNFDREVKACCREFVDYAYMDYSGSVKDFIVEIEAPDIDDGLDITIRDLDEDEVVYHLVILPDLSKPVIKEG